jgi:YidC/Oxa1 family membrane protein insertase
MAEAFGVILRFLGAVLSAIYDFIPSYALAIVLLTILVRIVLIPLTVKQIRSMNAMQKLQPELKRLQAKYKGDRQKMNEELMKLYREHGVNPLGGCFPLLMQAPVFIALYSVLRATIPVEALPVPGTNVTMNELSPARTICQPADPGAVPTTLICRVQTEKGETEREVEVQVVAASIAKSPSPANTPLPRFVTICRPATGRSDLAFGCRSPVGTGHLPRENGEFKPGSLGDALVKDQATFLGMHLACSPTQATSKSSIRECTAREADAGGASLIAYYSLVLLMMGSTYYQQRQMSAQATGPQAKQMQMMGRIMPIFLGFISLSIPAGVLIYWVVSNIWTIGQQRFFLQKQSQSAPPPEAPKGKQAKPKPKR